MIYEVEIEGRSHRVAVERAEGGWTVRIDDGPARAFSGRSVGRAEWILREGGVGRPVGCWVDGEHASLQIAGHALRATVADPRAKALAHATGAGEGVVLTTMPGVVVRILVAEGDEVAEGQVLLVVEAMKMENEFKAPCAGTVQTLHVAAGTAVEANSVLVTVDPS